MVGVEVTVSVGIGELEAMGVELVVGALMVGVAVGSCPWLQEASRVIVRRKNKQAFLFMVSSHSIVP